MKISVADSSWIALQHNVIGQTVFVIQHSEDGCLLY